jgi:hypothetical protein
VPSVGDAGGAPVVRTTLTAAPVGSVGFVHDSAIWLSPAVVWRFEIGASGETAGVVATRTAGESSAPRTTQTAYE